MAESAKKYISVDSSTQENSSDKVKLTNSENEFQGTFKTKDSDNNIKDIKEIFLDKSAFKDIQNVDDPYDMESVVDTLNQIISGIKNGGSENA